MLAGLLVLIACAYLRGVIGYYMIGNTPAVVL